MNVSKDTKNINLTVKNLAVNQTGSNINDFIELQDTPASYAGAGGKLVSVKDDLTGLEFIENGISQNVNLYETYNGKIYIYCVSGFQTSRVYGFTCTGKFYDGRGTEYTSSISIGNLGVGEFIILTPSGSSVVATKGTGSFKDYLVNYPDRYLFAANISGWLYSPFPAIQELIDTQFEFQSRFIFCDPGSFEFATSGTNTVTVTSLTTMIFYFGDGVNRSFNNSTATLTETDGIIYMVPDGDDTVLHIGQQNGLTNNLYNFSRSGIFPIFQWIGNRLTSFFPEIQSRIDYLYKFQNKTLVDNATISADCLSSYNKMFSLSTAQSAIVLTLSNVVANAVYDFSIIKTIAGDVTVTLAGTNLTFRGYGDAGYGSNPDVILSGTTNDLFTISIKVTGLTSGANKICMVALGEKAN